MIFKNNLFTQSNRSLPPDPPSAVAPTPIPPGPPHTMDTVWCLSFLPTDAHCPKKTYVALSWRPDLFCNNKMSENGDIPALGQFCVKKRTSCAFWSQTDSCLCGLKRRNQGARSHAQLTKRLSEGAVSFRFQLR